MKAVFLFSALLSFSVQASSQGKSVFSCSIFNNVLQTTDVTKSVLINEKGEANIELKSSLMPFNSDSDVFIGKLSKRTITASYEDRKYGISFGTSGISDLITLDFNEIPGSTNSISFVCTKI